MICQEQQARKSLLGVHDQIGGEEFGRVITSNFFQEFYHHGGKSGRGVENRCGIEGASFLRRKKWQHICRFIRITQKKGKDEACLRGDNCCRIPLGWVKGDALQCPGRSCRVVAPWSLEMRLRIYKHRCRGVSEC